MSLFITIYFLFKFHYFILYILNSSYASYKSNVPGAPDHNFIDIIKVNASDGERDEVKRLVDIFHSRVIDVTDTTYTIEITGNGEKLNAFVEALSSITILEVVRSGLIGISRGEKSLS